MNPSYNNGSGSNAGQPGGVSGDSGMLGVSGVKPGVIASGSDTDSSAPGVKPGVIASGPDVATPKDAPAIEIASETTPGLSLGSRHLFKKPRAGAPKRDMIVSVGGAAGAVSDGTSRGPKKGLIIGGLVVIILLIVGLVVGMMVMNGGKKGGGDNGQTQTATGDYAQYYNYANYILDGEDNANVELGEYDASKKYAAIVAFNKGNIEYFNRANELWKVFYELISNNESISEVSRLRGSADYQNELMDFVVKYINTKDYKEEDLFELYVRNGFDGANSIVDKDYADLLETTYEFGKDYAAAKLKSIKTSLSLYDKYNSLGCIKNEKIDGTCADNHKNEIKDLIKQYDNDYKEINNEILNEAIRMLIKNCFTIKNDLDNVDVEKEVLNSATNPEVENE